MQIVIDEKKMEKVLELPLKSGAHSKNDAEMCIMEAVAFVAGEPWSDSPQCTCSVIAAFLRSWNDGLPNDAERNRLLKPLIPKIIGTRNPKLKERRSLMAADWLVRTHTSAWLRLAGLTAQAESLESLPEITSMKQVPSIRPAIEAVRKDAAAARDAAWDAATAPATDAARDAARDAAWDAAWAAARDAAWAPAWAPATAAARDAAWAAAWEKLKPTQELLQQSAVKLIERMCELQ